MKIFTDDWKTFHRRLSTWFEGAAITLTSYLAAVPDGAIKIWNTLPDDVKTVVPPVWIQWSVVALIAIGALCKIIDQPNLKPKVNSGVGPESKP